MLAVPVPFEQEKSGRGFGGNSTFLLPNQNEASPATCPNTWRAEHRRKILFSLKEEKIGRAQNEKSKENFSVVWRACRAVAGVPARQSFSVGGGFLSWGFAQRMFELRPKNTASTKREHPKCSLFVSYAEDSNGKGVGKTGVFPWWKLLKPQGFKKFREYEILFDCLPLPPCVKIRIWGNS